MSSGRSAINFLFVFYPFSRIINSQKSKNKTKIPSIIIVEYLDSLYDGNIIVAEDKKRQDKFEPLLN